MKDAESDVRIAAVTSLVQFVKMINSEKIYILVPPIQALARDNSLQVRSGICEVISTVIPLVGKDISVSKLYPYLLELVEDKETDVRIACVKTFVKFVDVLGAELMNSLIPHIKNLMEDKKWRVREATYQTLIDLALSYQVILTNEKVNH